MRNLISETFWCVQHLNIFRDLSETDARALEQITTFRHLNHSERICTEGVYLIKEGRVKIADTPSEPELETPKNTDTDEKQQTKEVLEEGEIFGVVPNDANISKSILDENNPCYAETLSDVCLGVVTIRDFSFFLKRKPHVGLPLPLLYLKRAKMPHVFSKVHSTFSYGSKKNGNWHPHSYKLASNILRKNKTPDTLRFNRLTNIVFRCASSRFALLLHNLAGIPDSKGIILTPRLSKKRISRLIGSATETTETLLRTFKQHNVIKKRRGRIQVLNPWHLKKIADASMKTLKAPTVPDTAADDDFGLELLANLSNENNIQTGSTVSQSQTVTKT